MNTSSRTFRRGICLYGIFVIASVSFFSVSQASFQLCTKQGEQDGRLYPDDLIRGHEARVIEVGETPIKKSKKNKKKTSQNQSSRDNEEFLALFYGIDISSLRWPIAHADFCMVVADIVGHPEELAPFQIDLMNFGPKQPDSLYHDKPVIENINEFHRIPKGDYCFDATKYVNFLLTNDQILKFGDGKLRFQVRVQPTSINQNGQVDSYKFFAVESGNPACLRRIEQPCADVRIKNIYPTKAWLGDTIKIHGVGFGSPGKSLSIGGVEVSSSDIQSWTDTDIKLSLPENASPGIISVLNDCGRTGISKIKFNLLLRVADINFDIDKADLKPSSYRRLNEVAKIINRSSQYKVEIIGHTAKTGDPRFSLRLSLNRARSVLEYIVMQGCSRSRLKARGRGSQENLVKGEAGQFSAQNRRVEFRFYK